MMYHATKDERGTLRNKLDRAQSKRRKLSSDVHGNGTNGSDNSNGARQDEEGVLPVLITSYDIAVNDRKYLQRYKVNHTLPSSPSSLAPCFGNTPVVEIPCS